MTPTDPTRARGADTSPGNALRDAFALLQSGRAAEAEARVARLLETHPDDPAVQRGMAMLAAATGRPALALAHMETASRLAPASALLRTDLGRLLAGAGRLPEALAAFEDATRLEPTLAEAWFFAGITFARLQRDGEARQALARADALEPGRAEIMAPLADLAFRVGDDATALPLWQRLVAMRPTDEDAALKLGETLTRQGRHADARRAFRDALARLPASPGLWMALGQAEEDAGDRTEAEAAYREALVRQPGWVFPLAGLLGLRRADAPEEFVAAAETLQRGDTLPDAERALLGFPLGRIFDSRKAPAKAMAAWQDANAARRREIGALDRTRFDAEVARIETTWRAGAWTNRRGSDDPRPVFIVGMPRSGTTLVEQVIASHPQAAGCGELPDLGQLAAHPLQDAAALADAAQRWLASAERHASRAGALRLVDKAPLNFYHLGLAAALFPNARIVWCRRDARDVALSIFSENFALESQFATDLGDIGATINAQHRLMRHWQQVLPLPIHEVRYEDFVADLDTQAPRLIEFLGLPWDDACLAFHASDRAVQTPSRWQVRRPAHTGSIGRWRPYADWLAPLDAVLARSADDDGVVRT